MAWHPWIALIAPGLVTAHAQAPPDAPAGAAAATLLPCLVAAAQYHAVHPGLLRAILKVESDFRPDAVNRNSNGTLDVGMAQINSIHFAELARWGVAPGQLMDGCTATYVAAWHLSRQIRRHGNSWFGVAAYHSTSPCQNSRYASLLWNALLASGEVAGSRLSVPSLRSCQSGARAGRETAAGPQAPSVAFDAP